VQLNCLKHVSYGSKFWFNGRAVGRWGGWGGWVPIYSAWLGLQPLGEVVYKDEDVLVTSQSDCDGSHTQQPTSQTLLREKDNFVVEQAKWRMLLKKE
jgi:hypothetical protein